MTNEQINAAIAEACGWTGFHTEGFSEMGVPCFVPMALPPGFIHIENLIPLPNYCTDLNAMHEAEKTLNIIEQGHYWDHLKDLTDEGFDQLHATARQRAEAFLRTLGKWREVQP